MLSVWIIEERRNQGYRFHIAERELTTGKRMAQDRKLSPLVFHYDIHQLMKDRNPVAVGVLAEDTLRDFDQ